MTRNPPPDDWVVYLVVLGTVALMMFGKYLMGRGDKDEVISNNQKSLNQPPLKKSDIIDNYI